MEDECQWKRFLQKHGYILCHQIGYGSFGDVFSVMTSSQSADTKYAIKRLLTRRNILEDEYAMMEIHTLLQLQHQNIIPVQEVFLSKKVACIVMELAPLGNLEMFFKTSGSEVTTEFVTSVFSQVLSAVDFCHSHFLAHRDINPSNVLVFNPFLVKLADFGLCFQCTMEGSDDIVLCSDYLGHDTYLAPEVKLCKPFHAMHADIWSLGCVLRFLATSSHCFDIDQSSSAFNCNSNNNNSNNCSSQTLGTVNKSTTKYSTETETTEISQKSSNSSAHTNKRNNPNITVTCFVQNLCQHSPLDRPTASETLVGWKKAIEDIKCENCDKNTPLAAAEKEE